MLNRNTVIIALVAVIGVGAIVFGASHFMHHDHPHHADVQGNDVIKIENPFARASASADVKVGAGYLKLTNMADTADMLIEAKGDVARSVQLHSHMMQNGNMVMAPIEGGVALPPGQVSVFEPGGNHIMFIGLNSPLVEGETIPLTLVFKNAGEVAIEIPILGIGAMEHDGHSSDGDHNH